MVGSGMAALRATSATPMAPVPDARLTVTVSSASPTSSEIGLSMIVPVALLWPWGMVVRGYGR